MYVGLIGDLLFFRMVLIDWYFSQEGQEGRDGRKGQEGQMYKSKIVKLYLNNCCFHIKIGEIIILYVITSPIFL